MKQITTFPNMDSYEFKTENGDWKDADEWPHIDVIQQCETQGCQAFEIKYALSVAVNVDGIIRTHCAGCGGSPAVYIEE